MAGNDDIAGTDWSDEQQDLIVADYFAMLQADLAGEKINKAEHNRVLQALTRRSRGSIERKHMNITAALIGLEMKTLPGYAPNDNFQRSIVSAIGRFLDAHPVLSYEEPRRVEGLAAPGSMFLEPPPPLSDLKRDVDPRLERVARKHDRAQRDARNRALGRAGEECVLEFERRRLHDGGAPDLSKRVRWVADLEGDGHGYDIHSFAQSGEDRLIEVKTTNGPRTTPFFLSRNEERVSRERKEFRIYRLYDFENGPKLFKLPPPLRDGVKLETEVWKASFG